MANVTICLDKTKPADLKLDLTKKGYVKALANNFYGIKKVNQIKAEGLDVVGGDVDRILDSVSIKLDSHPMDEKG